MLKKYVLKTINRIFKTERFFKQLYNVINALCDISMVMQITLNVYPFIFCLFPLENTVNNYVKEICVENN